MATFALLTLMVVKCPVGICPTVLPFIHGHVFVVNCLATIPKKMNHDEPGILILKL